MESEKKSTELQKQEAQEVPVERVCSSRTHAPAVDVVEKPEEILVLADLPGVKTQDVDIEFEKGRLTLSARVDPTRSSPGPGSGKPLLREYGVGDFRRTFLIGEGIESDRIEAEMNDGVLTLHLPKRASAVTRKIPIESNRKTPG